MKISIGYPSLDDPRGFHQTGQNRQAQVFTQPAFIYPYIPAMAATLLKQAGHEVLWSDGSAEGLTWEQQMKQLVNFHPDLVAWEVKTPSVIGTWNKVDNLKSSLPSCKVVLMGDHVTALPEESIAKSGARAIITGGDYDFALCELVKHFENQSYWPDGLQSAQTVHPNGASHSYDRYIFDHPTTSDLKTLPPVNRILTKWHLYGYERGSGNYKYLPGTHIMIGRDCWWRHQGGCTFCSWTNTFKNWRVGTVDQFMAEIENCASLGIREVFDDTGTFPIGNWLNWCCVALTKFNNNQRHGMARVTVGCNMRPGTLSQQQYQHLAHAGFRFLLYGLESFSPSTRKRLNKENSPVNMEQSFKWAKEAGLEPHVTCMVGYPWETKKEAQETINFTKRLFENGYIDTLQATICIPYPGTELYRQCLENDWLKYKPGEWDNWDMSKPVMKCPLSDIEVLELTRGIYKSFLTPRYLARKVLTIRTKDDFKFMLRGLKLLYGHLTDFNGRRSPIAIH